MILSYSIISSLILVFCYPAYRFLMADQRQHAINRSIVLLTYAAALLLPIAVLAAIFHTPHPATDIAGIEIGQIEGGIAGDKSALHLTGLSSVSSLIYMIYLAGLTIFACYYLCAMAMLLRLMAKGEQKDFGDFSLILVDDSHNIAPFSWKRSIVMRKSDYEENGEIILIHEYAHSSLNHWADLLLAHLVICLQWYNPAAWAMKKELRAIHEYQADESVIETGTDAKEYQMLLLKQAVGSRYQSFANSLNHSKLKKRVTMMYKKKTSARRRLFALALIPAIGAGLAVTSIPAVAGVLESLATTTASISATASSEAAPKAADKKKTIYEAVEKDAEFPGEMQGLIDYLMKNIRYPEEAHKANEQGRVIVQFVINEDGSVSDIEVLRGVSESLDKEAVRVISEMPKWSPAQVNGKNVASRFTLPVMFKLQDDKPKTEN
ncbi:MAG: M56 family metallopeptidase [Muribaculaceae bacterium]|nr:M56 family metallopeptidase [Muribaculaceae bacterium]